MTGKQASGSSWKQYERQGMFGTPCSKPRQGGIFNLVWTYSIKNFGSNKKKARCTCDGSPRSGQAHTLDHTYAACIDQNAASVFYAASALCNNVIVGGDAPNTFREAHGPQKQYFLRSDAQFCHWWATHLRRPPFPPDYVVPVRGNMQGHQEALRLWAKHIHRLLKSIVLTPTQDEPCLYRGT